MVPRKTDFTRPQYIGIAFLVLIVIGIALYAQTLIREEQRDELRELLAKGNYLVSLISLHPTEDFNGDKRDFFLRTVTQYTTYEGLVYFFVHNDSGYPIVSLTPSDLAAQIPSQIETASLNAMGLTKNTFHVDVSETPIYEFAKPIFENGKKTGTVRLGLKPSTVSLFSFQRMRFLGMIAFFISAIILLLYYGITVTLRPLKRLEQDFKKTCTDLTTASPGAPASGDGIGSTIKALEQSLTQVKQKLTKIEEDNVELASKLGVITFEKNQIVNILDAIKFGVIITDIQDNISYINNYMLKLLKKNSNEVIGRPFGEIIAHDKITSFISQQGVGKQNPTTGRIEIAIPDLAPGETFRVTHAYLQDGEKTLIGKMISIQNITSEKLAEINKHEFIAHVAHELKTPLTTIKSYNEMLMDGEVQDHETQKEFYNTINEETDRLTRLIQDLLNMSKIELGALTIEKGLVKTDSLIGDCVAAIEVPAQKKHIAIEKILPDNFPTLLGDKELLKVAIINLLNNAVKYTPEEGKITLSLKDQDQMVVFDVVDTGYGISKEDLRHIFKRSFRSRDPHVAEQSGTGLGLAITAEIIRLHGGRIKVQSELRQGSHFRIGIPKQEFYLGKQ